MGRAQFIKQTYPVNLTLAKRHLSDFEFVLVNYHSPDDLDRWVEVSLDAEISTGLVKYVRTDKPTHFHHAHAKNIAHRHATKDIVVNLDADNFLSIFYLYALGTLTPKHFLTVRYSKFYLPGTIGRLALFRKDFLALGGYDEKLNQGWGFEDDDLLYRSLAFGLKRRMIFSPLIGKIMPHSEEERHRYTLDPNPVHSEIRDRSTANINAGRIVANLDTEWGALPL